MLKRINSVPAREGLNGRYAWIVCLFPQFNHLWHLHNDHEWLVYAQRSIIYNLKLDCHLIIFNTEIDVFLKLWCCPHIPYLARFETQVKFGITAILNYFESKLACAKYSNTYQKPLGMSFIKCRSFWIHIHGVLILTCRNNFGNLIKIDFESFCS